MATSAPSTPISCGTTAQLRVLGAELNGWLTGIGLTQTTDTGQINWTTVTLPATNTAIGYEIYAFPDLSIYFRLDYKTSAVLATRPLVMSLTVGTGSNGSGTITGQTTTANLLINNATNNITSNIANYPTYICLNSDVFWIAWKVGAMADGSAAMTFSIEKAVDSTGTVNNTGFVVTYSSNLNAFPNIQAVRTAATATTFTATTASCVVPGNLANSSTNSGQKQTFLHQYAIPDVILSNAVSTVVLAEATLGTTLTATLVGTSPQTMISMGNQFGLGNSASTASTWANAFRWQ